MEVLVLGNEVLLQLRGNRGAAERWREALGEKEGKTRTISAHTGSRDLGTFFSKRGDKWRQQQCRTQNGVSLFPNFCL